MDHPEGAGSKRADRVEFDRRVHVVFRGAQLSSDGGLLAMRELDVALGSAWDEELEPFRHAGDDTHVVWLHKVG